jgi:hypothetical protein
VFGDAAAGSDGGAASAGDGAPETSDIEAGTLEGGEQGLFGAIGAEDAFDDAEMAQTGELSG